MSSARSITAARARRAGETPVAQNPVINRGNNNVVNKGRVVGQQAQQQQIPQQRQQQQQFQQQQQQFQQQQQQRQQFQQQPQQQFQEYDQNDMGYDEVQQPRIPNPKGRITIGDAIGLITIRLGRVEQYIQQLQEDGHFLGGDDEERAQGGQSQVLGVDSSVFKSIVDRLDKLESKQTQPQHQQQKDVVDRLEKELKETKDLLMMVVLKHEKHTGESSIKFDNINSKVVSVEDKVKILEEDMENLCGDINNLYLQKQNSFVNAIIDDIIINDNESDFKASSIITEHSKTQGQDMEIEYSDTSNTNKDSEDISKRMYVPLDNDLDLDSNDGLQGLDIMSKTGTYLQEQEQEQQNDISNPINQLSGQYKSNSFTYDPNVIQ